MARPTAGPSRKRRVEVDPDDTQEPSPEPAPQRRRVSIDDNADNDDIVSAGEPDNDDGAYGGDAGGGNNAEVSLDQLVKKLVRLALACEYQRRPLRRADISEKVLSGGPAGRRFRDVFQRAQADLRAVFGMQLVELPAREKVTVAQKRAAAAKQSQNAKAASASTAATSWILTSVLPSQFRDPAIIAPPAAPTPEEDATYTGLYTTLIALISLSGNALPEAKLERFLRRLQLTDSTPLDGGRERTDKVLKRMEKEGYVVRVKESVGTGDDDVYWTVGPRGKVEVGNDGVRGLVRAVYAPADEAEADELERRVARNLGIGERTRRAAEDGPVQAGDGEGRKRRGRPKRAAAERDEENSGDGDDFDD